MSAPQPLRDRVTFSMNVPQEITLDGTGNPTATAARDGSAEVRYFLAGHRIMWVPQAVAHAIHNANAGEDASFAITKHRAPKPWTVVHLEDEPAAAHEPPPPVSQPRTTAIQCGCGQPATIPARAGEPPRYCRHCAIRAAETQVHSEPWPAPSQSPTPAPGYQPPPTHHTEPAPPQSPQHQLPAAMLTPDARQPYSSTLYNCFAAALRVALEVEKFGASIGRPVSFATGDIRAMGTTLFIEARKS